MLLCNIWVIAGAFAYCPSTSPQADSRGARTRQSDEAEAESSRREAFVKARRDVLELGAATFEGRDRRVWEGKRLASLGATAALLKPKHKMPLKMLFGVQSKQRHLEKFRLGRERESGVVSGRSATGKLVHGARKSKAEAMAQRRRKTGRLGGVSSLDDDGMRGGVLRVGGIRGGRGRGRGRGRGKA